MTEQERNQMNRNIETVINNLGAADTSGKVVSSSKIEAAAKARTTGHPIGKVELPEAFKREITDNAA